jgi:hypothetical protein
MNQGVHQEGEESLVAPNQGIKKNRKGNDGAMEQGNTLDAVLGPHKICYDIVPILNIGDGDEVIAPKLTSTRPIPDQEPCKEAESG